MCVVDNASVPQEQEGLHTCCSPQRQREVVLETRELLSANFSVPSLFNADGYLLTVARKCPWTGACNEDTKA